MVQECKFCPDCDIQQHVPSLAVDIEKAIQTGIVSELPVTEDFNHLDIDTVQNGVRLREPFDAVEFGSTLARSATEFSSGTGNVVTSSTPPAEAEGSGN